MRAHLDSPVATFIVQVAVILAVSRLMGLLARRIRQPMVVAEMTAGIVLGPSLLGWLAPSVSAFLFPVDSLPVLGTVSQFGLVLFMFLIGLEVDPNLLRGRGRASLLISHTSILVPFVLGATLGIWLHRVHGAVGIPKVSFILFMGIAMSVTAFPVLARVLVERRLMQTKIGAIVIACAAIDDITAWCLLAFVLSIVRASGLIEAARTTLFSLGYVVLMLGIVRPLLARLGERREPTTISQNLMALTLVFLLLSSLATDLIGIHLLFGAFLLGAVVPREHGLAKVLSDKIETVVVVLLLPLFFAYSGLRTRLATLATGQAWATCLLIVLVACVGKFGGGAVAARISGLSWRESGAIGILMNTRGLMELVVLNIGLDLGIIPPTVFAMMVMMALITTFATTPLLESLYPASEMAITPDLTPASVSRHPPKAYTLLACVAFGQSGPSLISVGAAIAGARRDQNTGRIYALRIIPPGDHDPLRRGHQSDLEQTAFAPLLARANALSVAVDPLWLYSPQPAREICEVAEVKRADLVLLGWHRPLIGTARLGGTVHQVMQSSHADVAVLVEMGGVDEIRRVLVPYLGSEHDRAALRLTQRIAQHSQADVTILHVVDRDRAGGRLGAEERMRETFAPAHEGGEQTGFDVRLKVVEHATPAEAVIDEIANEYDLVVIGVGREWGLEHRPFGIQSEAILKMSRIPVLVVRAGNLA